MTMKLDPKAEWAQMYNDAWRILRDWFYDPNMHGVDWNAIRDKYGALVPHVANRADLNFLLTEMGSELMAGHVYAERGDDPPRVTRVDGGLLGAEIVPDASGYFRIAKIFPGENWHESFRSPLTEPGVRAKAGDFILAVDGRTTRGVKNFYELLEGKADARRHALAQRPPRHGRRARGARAPRAERVEPALPRLGAVAPRAGREALGRAHRLHPRSRTRRSRGTASCSRASTRRRTRTRSSSTTATTAAASSPTA